MNLRSLVFVLSLTLAAPLFAAEEKGDDPLEGNVKFGYLATTGNTETSSLNTSFEAKYVADDWHHEAMASAINASENKVTTAEAYEAGWKSGWDFSERDYLFGRLNWRKDRFGGFDTQFSTQTATTDLSSSRFSFHFQGLQAGCSKNLLTPLLLIKEP